MARDPSDRHPDDRDPTVRRSWIVLYLLLALGLGAAAVLFVGGELVGTSGTVLPPPG